MNDFQHVRVLLIALLVISAGCAKSIVSVVHPSAGDYWTLVYMGEQNPPEGYVRAQIPPAVGAVLEEAVRAEIVDRAGYGSADAATADLLMYAGVGSRTNTENVNVVPLAVQSEIPNFGAYERDVTRGTLAFDVFERRTGLHVWHGHLAGESDGEFDADEFREMIVELFSTFPVAAAGTPPSVPTSGGETPGPETGGMAADSDATDSEMAAPASDADSSDADSSDEPTETATPEAA